jgi:D-alanyl-D-alanine carboxypeptidase
MNKNHLRIAVALVLTFFALTSCEKDTEATKNQLLINQLKSVTDSLLEATDIPGIVALVVDHKQGIDWLYATGYSDIVNKRPMDGRHTFRIGSNTKTFTGVVLLQLVDEGKLKLEDKLSKFYPEFPRADSITIEMLCNMTSGIYNFTDTEVWQKELFSNPTRVWTPEESVEIGFSEDFYFKPGEGWYYSNTNTLILGMIIEKLTGNSLATEVNNRIVNPLKLSNTGLLTSGTNIPGTHGRGYYAGEYEEGADMTEYFDVSWAWAAGSVYSTPRELQKYAEALVGGDFLSKELHQRQLNDMIVLSPLGAYGLCLLRRGSFYGHNGAVPGYTSSMYHSNEKQCTIIIYFNCQLDVMPDLLFGKFVKLMYEDE